MEQDSESSENEESLPIPSTLVDDLNSLIDSTSSVDFVLAVDSISPVPSTSSGIQENYDDFRFEAARRSSFQNWPVSSIDPASLAAAGLYYTGEMDIVRCFECQLEISQWSEGYPPMLIHELYSSDCKFVRNEHCNNVPIGADPDKYLRIKQRNRNTSCPYGLLYKESFDFKEHRFLRYKRNPTAYDLSRWGLKIVKKPENLDYASYQTRLDSFTTWPTYMTQTREQLAEAGFYYSGINDITTCYHCGIQIGSWRIEEDVWVQHANLSPGCPYLLTIRGTEYVNKVTGQELYEISEQVSRKTYSLNHMYN
jgi:baculoviral IAP repeat-containing protein 7/8